MPRTALLIAFSATLAACAQLDPAGSAARDAQLVRSILQANLAEIAAGRLAVSKARSRAVRRFGERMIEAHSALQADGSELKSAKGIPLPTRPDAGQEAALRQLEALSGEPFERAYLELTLKQHAEALRLYERSASRASDPALRAHAERAIPHIRRHLELARRLTANHLTSAKMLMG
jgi:putative membrane protein